MPTESEPPIWNVTLPPVSDRNSKDFIDGILKGRYPESDVETGWDSSIMGIAAMRSAREGRKFKIDPINHKVEYTWRDKLCHLILI